MNIDMDRIPNTTSEALKMFLEALTDEEKITLKELEEDQVAIFHHTWGQFLRNNWSMWVKDTPLTRNFKSMGITHADDMTGILLTCAWRQLNRKPLKLHDQVKKYQEYWQNKIGKPMP